MSNPIKYIDLHCDTILECWHGKSGLRTGAKHISLEKLKACGAIAQCFALFIPSNEIAEKYGCADKSSFDTYQKMLSKYNEEMCACSATFRKAFSAEDIINNDRNGFISSILTIEDAALLDGKIERLKQCHSDGVRMITLLWNYENCIGFPNSPVPEIQQRGLKPFGFEAIEKMNELGIIIDVSHLSEGGFWDVIGNTRKPIAASHSCAKALCNHPRNLSDIQAKAIADNGGVIGINFYSGFLTGNGTDTTTITKIIEHTLHFKNVCGIDTLAWGSDFDGISCDLEFIDCAGFPTIIRELSKVFSDDEIEKICRKNALRVFHDNE